MPPPPTRPRALHLAVLAAFAFAQPLFDLVGRSPEFLIARHVGPAELLLFTAILAAVVPTLAAALPFLARGPRVRETVHLAVLAALTALILLPAFKRLDGLTDAAAAASAALAGAAAAAAYARWEPVRLFASALTPCLALFPLLFLLRPDILAVAAAARARREPLAVPPAAASAPVVWVVFDELPLASLLGPDGGVDAGRLPNFARLARAAVWFRAATAVADETDQALPALLSGRRPTAGTLPLAGDHPQTAFTLLAPTHDLRVFEPVTELCPRSLCRRPALPPSARTAALLRDAAGVLAEVILPPGWARRFPAGGAAAPGLPGFDIDALTDRAPFDRFLAAVGASGRPPLLFLHSLVTHYPWRRYPSGRRYSADRGDEDPGPFLNAETWTADAGLVALARNRHLLAVGFADRLLGELLDRLAAAGLYDAALVIVTADHGMSLRPGGRRRALSPANARDILAVPLFIKPPGARTGRVDERAAETVDVLPTLAALLGLPLPLGSDGQALLSASYAERPDRRAFAAESGVSYRFGHELFTRPATGAGAPLSNDPFADPRPRLVGRGTAELTASGARRLDITLDDPAAFAAVDPAGPLVPGLVTGRIETRGPAGAPLELALALNGTVRATARSSNPASGPPAFAFLVPEASFSAGPNTAQVYALPPRGDFVFNPR